MGITLNMEPPLTRQKSDLSKLIFEAEELVAEAECNGYDVEIERVNSSELSSFIEAAEKIVDSQDSGCNVNHPQDIPRDAEEECCPHISNLPKPPGKFQGINQCPNGKCGNAIFNWVCLKCEKVFCDREENPVRHHLKHPECGLEVNCVTLRPYCRKCNRYIGDKEHPKEASLLRPTLEAVHMAKYGHTNGLRDLVAELGATIDQINETAASCRTVC